MLKTTMRLLPGLLAASLAGSAGAAGFQLWEQNASGIGTAFAGSAAVADNASTIFFNPAGMTLLPGRQLSLGLSGSRTGLRFRDAGSTAGGGNGGDAGQGLAVPNAYLSWQLGPQWFAGLGISSPFGLRTEYDDAGWVGRFHALESDLRTLNVNPSLAYRLSDKVAFGFGLNYQKLDVELSRLTAGGLSRFDGDDTAWGWNAGVLFTLSPSMRVGVAYRSAVDFRLEGSQTQAGVAAAARAGVDLPDTFTLSVWQRLSERWEAMGDLSYTNWSKVKRLDIVSAANGTALATETFGYDDSWRFAWGAAYKVNDAWKGRFGIAYDRSPVSDASRSARLPDNHRLWLSVGARWMPLKDAAVDVGYAYLVQRDAAIDQTAGTARLRGHYDNSAHILGAQYSQGF